MANTIQSVTEVITALEDAKDGKAYADTVIMEPQQTVGTRYKYILTNAPDPRES